jgi:nucleotide-binding universal stress UspA family protein
MCQVDGSIEAADAVVVVGQLARAWSVELHVVHVWSGLASAFTGLVAEDAARRLLADEAANAARRGAFISEQHFLIGPAAANIELLGDELGAMLCVMGQHRHSRVRRLLFGSVAAEILRVTVRPLLLVSSAADWPPTRLLVGDDGSLRLWLGRDWRRRSRVSTTPSCSWYVPMEHRSVVAVRAPMSPLPRRV